MLKKIILFFVIFFLFFNFSDFLFANCSYDWYWNVADALEDCVWGGSTDLVDNSWDLKIDWWFKEVIIHWAQKLATFLAFWAIFAIAFGSFKMVISTWQEDQIKKAKDIIKWWVIWFLWVVSAGFLISIVVKLIYHIWG